MKINKIRKIEYIIISILLVCLLDLYIILPIYASTKSELQSEASEIDKQIQETSSEIAGVKSQKSTALSQINTYNIQINGYQDEIDELQSQITEMEAQIAEKETNIQIQEVKYNEQQELLNKRLVALYESGTTSYLDLLLSSKGLADFISKYYLIEQLTEYDTALLQSIQDTKTQIENEKAELETSKQTLVDSKTAVETKKNSISSLVAEKNKLVTTLSAEEKELQDELEQFEKDKKEIQAQLQAIIAKESGSYTSTPSTAGYICPLAGKSKSNITTGYHGYSGHTGVDFACASGTKIMAAKAGTVVISTALRYSSGKYRSYGEYVVISHGDGTMTLYAHMSSRAVSTGTYVAQGQTIGYVGSTGNSTGPHLHFEVRVNGKCVNPTSYLP